MRICKKCGKKFSRWKVDEYPKDHKYGGMCPNCVWLASDSGSDPEFVYVKSHRGFKIFSTIIGIFDTIIGIICVGFLIFIVVLLIILAFTFF